MKKPTKKDQMMNLAKAITQVVWAKLVIKRNGDAGGHNLDEMSEEYREEVCKLPTNDLRFILLCHRKKIFPRQEDTISAITMELLEREILKEPNAGTDNTGSKKRRRSKA